MAALEAIRRFVRIGVAVFIVGGIAGFPLGAIALEAVLCTPDTQTVIIGEIATLQAAGGDSFYHWNVTGGGDVQRGGNATIGISYTVAGKKTVRVTSAGSTAACTVTVQSGNPPATTTAELTVQKSASNSTRGGTTSQEVVNVGAGDIVEFVVTVRSISDQPATNVVFQDSVPGGMSYISGSTSINGQPLIVETVTTTGLPLGTLQGRDEFTVRWSAVADRTGTLGVGVHEEHPLATLTADGIPVFTDEVTLQVDGSVAGPGGVQTGPGDITVLALIAASVLTLLYAGYARSSGFRTQEATKIAQDRTPLDFRS